MNSRERVLTAFEHREPDVVPRWCGASPEFVREKTREVLAIMAPGGGYVAGASHDTILEETPVENVLAMFDAVEEFSRGT